MNYGDLALFISAATTLICYLILQECKTTNRKDNCCLNAKSLKELIDKIDKIMGTDKVS